MSLKRKQLGQFYTENYKYIFQGLEIPTEIKIIIEPFTGQGDLLKFIPNNTIVECYDIEPKKCFITKRDTLLYPPIYNNKFILTNPPYLARNKSKDKTIFDFYNLNDLYKCFISSFLNDENFPIGGLIIIPLNFWCSIRDSDIKLRKQFLQQYSVSKLNIFEEQVFKDTSYTVCSFLFKIRNSVRNSINTVFYPSKKTTIIELNDNNNFIIGGCIYNLPLSNYKISRITSKFENGKTFLVLKCIDDNLHSQIRLEYREDSEKYIDKTPNLSNRTYATISIQPEISIEKQKLLANKFNMFLKEQRQQFNSLFLTNYRESSRKRISFDLAYIIISYLLK